MKRKVLDLLVEELKKTYPEKWGYAVDVLRGAMVKTVDNDADALTTIMNIRNHRGERSSIEDLIKVLGSDWGDGLSCNPRGGRPNSG